MRFIRENQQFVTSSVKRSRTLCWHKFEQMFKVKLYLRILLIVSICNSGNKPVNSVFNVYENQTGWLKTKMFAARTFAFYGQFEKFNKNARLAYLKKFNISFTIQFSNSKQTNVRAKLRSQFYVHYKLQTASHKGKPQLSIVIFVC